MAKHYQGSEEFELSIGTLTIFGKIDFSYIGWSHPQTQEDPADSGIDKQKFDIEDLTFFNEDGTELSKADAFLYYSEKHSTLEAQTLTKYIENEMDGSLYDYCNSHFQNQD